MNCSNCKNKMSFGDIWTYLKFKFGNSKTKNKYALQLKTPLCAKCSQQIFMKWTDDFNDRLNKYHEKKNE